MSQSNNKYKQGKGLGSEKKWEREREKKEDYARYAG